MFSSLIDFLRGYVIVSVSGQSVERFINLAASRGVPLRDVTRSGDLTRFSVLIKDYRLLYPCARKCGCKLRIVGKKGLPFFLFRHRKRKSLVIGAVMFTAIIFYLTSFVWLVTIDGVDRLDAAAVMERLSDLGVRAGGTKRGVRLRDVERELMKSFPDIAWINVSVKGTRAQVTVVETLPEAKPAETDGYFDIMASKDGIIVSMATEAGRPVTKPGDVVRAGDLLVSGELIAGSDDMGYQSYYIRARSEVLARRYYEYVINIPLVFEIKSFTGNVKRDYGIILFDKTLYLDITDNPYENYERIVKENRLSFGQDYPLPVTFFTVRYREFIPVTVHRSLEEAEIMGRTIVDARIERELTEVEEILDTEISWELDGDDMIVRARITVVERIGETRPLTPAKAVGVDDVSGGHTND